MPWECDAIVPVSQIDRDSRNAIPGVDSALLAKTFGVGFLSTVIRSNVVSHTGADAASRIIGRPRFDGQVRDGLRVVIVDDVVT
jgi:hypothetical protein